MAERVIKVNIEGVEILGYNGRQTLQVLPVAMNLHQDIVDRARRDDLRALREAVVELREGEGNGWDSALDEVLALIDKELK